MIDFTAYRHPVLTVACPTCHKRAGVWCERPSGHDATDLHKECGVEADRVFIGQHGEDASIEDGRHLLPRDGEHIGAGGFWINPKGRIAA